MESFLIQWGASVSALVFTGEYWRLFSSMFVHIGFVHLAMNMAALLSIGPILERKTGTAVFIAIYLLSGLSGSLVSAIWHNEGIYVSCGASGALLGLIGAALAQMMFGIRFAEMPIKNLLICLALTFGCGAFLSFDNAAHLGGLVSGFVLSTLVLLLSLWCPRLAIISLAGISLTFFIFIAVVAGWFYNPEKRAELVSAKLLEVFGHVGLGGSEFTLAGVPFVENCVSAVLDNTPDGSNKTDQFKTCAEPGVDSSWLVNRLHSEYKRCRELTVDLKTIYADPESMNVLSTIDRYCAQQDQLYRAVFDKSADAVDLSTARATREKMWFLLEMSNIDYDGGNLPDAASARALNAILRRSDTLSQSLVELLSCPYTSCSRL